MKVIGKLALLTASIWSGFFVMPSYPATNSGQTVQTAASEYLAALSDGTLDGYFLHEKSYQEITRREKQSLPSDMWKQRENELRSTAKTELEQNARQNIYSLGTSLLINSECTLIVRTGATVKIKEVRPTDTSHWQVFYDISYADSQNAPQIYLRGKYRFFRSGVFSVIFEKPGGKNLVAESYCHAIDSTVATWPVPPLAAKDAIAAAPIPKNMSVEIFRSVGLSSGTNWRSWKEFLDAGQMLKSILEKHGWTVSGFQIPSVGYYSIAGTIEPPDSAKKYLGGLRRDSSQVYGYQFIFLEHAEHFLYNFSPREDTATAVIDTTYSGCTVICDFWQEVRSMPPYIGKSIFSPYNPSFDLSNAAIRSKIEFAWTPNRGWFVVR